MVCCGRGRREVGMDGLLLFGCFLFTYVGVYHANFAERRALT